MILKIKNQQFIHLQTDEFKHSKQSHIFIQKFFTKTLLIEIFNEESYLIINIKVYKFIFIIIHNCLNIEDFFSCF